MKKILSFLFVIINLAAYAQNDFPYGKMLKMSNDELIAAKFKYDKTRNQYVLTKTNGLNATSNVLSALNGTTADIRPHNNDYKVIIQRGVSDVSSIDVIFYDDETYHKIVTFANDKGKDVLSTSSGKLNKMQFNYENYAFVLSLNIQEIKATTGRTNSALVKTKDESYNIYTFTILTGVEPASEWHTKEALKNKKREEKGRKKQSASDLM